MEVLVKITTLLNSVMNTICDAALGPMITAMPGWLSNLIISAVVGVLALVIYKYTSNQTALGKVWDSIKAHMLGLMLFKDSIAVTLQIQWQLFKYSLLLLFHSIRPMIFMIVPISLLLSQLGLWYQARPMLLNETAILAITVNDEMIDNVKLTELPGAKILVGPVTNKTDGEINWQIQATEQGLHNIVFNIGTETASKELVIGEGFKRTSLVKPSTNFGQLFMNPAEKPFAADSPVKSISIEYPARESMTSGTDWWIGYFFIMSLIAALILKPILKVK